MYSIFQHFRRALQHLDILDNYSLFKRITSVEAIDIDKSGHSFSTVSYTMRTKNTAITNID